MRIKEFKEAHKHLNLYWLPTKEHPLMPHNIGCDYCGGAVKDSGIVHYTSPLIYEYVCTECNQTSESMYKIAADEAEELANQRKLIGSEKYHYYIAEMYLTGRGEHELSSKLKECREELEDNNPRYIINNSN